MLLVCASRGRLDAAAERRAESGKRETLGAGNGWGDGVSDGQDQLAV